eukprot:m.114291 g.114291  ORF g.114291 m.114291 type:complete len:146 (+) comp15361_c0_seq29:4392-4829(+)
MVLDDGLSFLNASLIAVGSNILGVPWPVGTTFNGTVNSQTHTTDVTLHFNELQNLPDNTNTRGDIICIEVAAIVANKPANVNGKELSAMAILKTDGHLVATSIETIQIIEPAIVTDDVKVDSNQKPVPFIHLLFLLQTLKCYLLI